MRTLKLEFAGDATGATLRPGEVLTARNGVLVRWSDNQALAREQYRVDPGEVRTFGPYPELRDLHALAIADGAEVEVPC